MVLTLFKERELRKLKSEREEKRMCHWPVEGNPHVFLLSLWLPDLMSVGEDREQAKVSNREKNCVTVIKQDLTRK